LFCYPSFKCDAQSATHTVAVSSVAGQVTLDAAAATQVFYSVSSVAERILGPFLVAEKIYSVQYS
jgi:hypothetical protein